MYLFFENKKLKAVFDDETEMKKQVMIYILKFHLSNNFFKNMDEGKMKLRNKLYNLFSKDLYFMESFNNTWFISEVEVNKINKEIKIINFNTRYTKINVKGKNLTKKDLYVNIPNLETDKYYK